MTETKSEKKWYESPRYVVGFELMFLLGTMYVGHKMYQDLRERQIAEQTEYQCRRTVEELTKKGEKGERITRSGIEGLLQNLGGVDSAN